MQTENKIKEKQRLEHSLLNRPLDFSAEYMTVSELHHLVRKNPDDIEKSTVQALTQVLESKTHISQTKSLFLYREAADCLAAIPILSKNRNMGFMALKGLKHAVSTTTHTQHRAAAEALGTLPVSVYGPGIHVEKATKPKSLSWNEMLAQCQIPPSVKFKKIGRSYVAGIESTGQILIIKTDRNRDNSHALHKEALWMEYLNKKQYHFSVRFEIPVPIRMNGALVFRLNHNPASCFKKKPTNKYGIAFWTHPDYFRYPNDHHKEKQLSENKFRHVISNNALLLGSLSSFGIIHTAPIPLFHNRIQQRRRTDQGIYEWSRGGRLDRWLHSSRYPNFGVSGIRDFEHFSTLNKKAGNLYGHIGTHLLSLVLVAGSYFRHKKSNTTGFDKSGKPVDLRHLFDPTLFGELLQQIFLNYYQGFTGHAFQDTPPFDEKHLAHCLIEEMGVDRHMEEVLRAADRKEMTDKELDRFLSDRGYSQTEIDSVKTNNQDIIIHTGPHLGRFNRRISVPYLIFYLETCSALCIWGKFRHLDNSILN